MPPRAEPARLPRPPATRPPLAPISLGHPPLTRPTLGSFILIEISDTIKDGGRGPVWHMKRAVAVAVSIITGF